ncbi:MAG: aminotransferase class V-fold PLP-dependent enzyme, partial [Alphaproteobacteria bacterium]
MTAPPMITAPAAPLTYLDWNATAPLSPVARAAVIAALEVTGNPSSVHGAGRAARRLVEDAREQVAALAGVAPSGIVFTASGTEANGLALHQAPAGRPVAVSAIEHDSLLAPLGALPAARRVHLPVTATGRLDVTAAAELIARHRPGLVSLMLANNETGVIQPVAEVAALARAVGALVHCDAVQAPGRMACDLLALGVHMMSLSAHKLGGPKGAAALVLADGLEIRPLLAGGGQERRRRAGTEAVPALAGFGA